MHSYNTTELLISGYIRSYQNHNHFLRELLRICVDYYWLRLPKFKLNNHDNIDYTTADGTISCFIPPTTEDEDIYDCLWSDDANKCVHATSTVLWQKSDAIQTSKNQNSTNVFKFEMKCVDNFNSFGVGICSKSKKIRYLIWIEAHYGYTYRGGRWPGRGRGCGRSRAGRGRSRCHNTQKVKCDSYLKFTKETKFDNETNHEIIQLSEYGDSLSVILNYDQNVTEFYHNDNRIMCMKIDDKESFYPIFCFTPNVCVNAQINAIPFKKSRFVIKSCDLYIMNNNRMFNESLVTIQKYNNEMLSFCVLQIEPDDYNGIYFNEWSDVKQNVFDLLWKGYNFLNLKQFDNKLSNVINKLRNIKFHPYDEDNYYDWEYKNRLKPLMINLWILIEIFQYFRRQYIELISNIIMSNQKTNNSNYCTCSVPLIITDYILQNFDVDYEHYFVLDRGYLQRLCKIYVDLAYGCSGDPFLQYTTTWFDENILPKLTWVPKQIWVTHTWPPCSFYYWKYYYHTKETIVYKPGVILYTGEDHHHPDQTDWQCNPLMICYDLAHVLVAGYIRILFNQQQNYKYLSVSITTNCLNYYFVCIPNFTHKKVLYPNLHDDNDEVQYANGYRPKVEECKQEINIDIDYKNAIVSYKHNGNKFDNNYKWANNIFEGIWKQIQITDLEKKYVHKFEMQSIQNFYSFAIGITRLSNGYAYQPTYCICMEQKENNAKLSVNTMKLRGYRRNDETDIENEIKQMEINKGAIGDKLGLILNYHKCHVTFYYNDQVFACVDLGEYVEIIPYDDGDAYIDYKCFYHPIFSFKAKESYGNKDECSKYKILSCHLQVDEK